jgi:hypothetical protein
MVRLKKKGCNEEWTFRLLILSRNRERKNRMNQIPAKNSISPKRNRGPSLTTQM